MFMACGPDLLLIWVKSISRINQDSYKGFSLECGYIVCQIIYICKKIYL